MDTPTAVLLGPKPSAPGDIATVVDPGPHPAMRAVMGLATGIVAGLLTAAVTRRGPAPLIR